MKEKYLSLAFILFATFIYGQCDPNDTITLKGSATICQGETTNLILSNTIVAAEYQLNDGTSDIGDVILGTGADIYLPVNPSVTTTYNIKSSVTCSTQFTYTSTTTVTVNPTPDVTATNDEQIICSGENIDDITFSGNVTGTAYNWTRNTIPGITGIGTSGTGTISGALSNTTNAPIDVIFTITPTADSCDGASIQATVTVNPTPDVTATNDEQIICSGENIDDITFSGNVT
ncbi:PKD-like domain-containing protein, partial [Flavobacterium chuncheonense]